MCVRPHTPLLLALLLALHHLPLREAKPVQSHKIPSNSLFEHPPAYCAPMLRNPRPMTATCYRNRTSMRCVDGSYQLFSQMAQDFYLYSTHFRYLGRRGVYLDIATNDPIGISNTFFFDACLSWHGLCAEANPQYLAAIHRFRSCALVPTCVSDVDGRNVAFMLHSALSGIANSNKNAKEWKQTGEHVPVVRQKCTTVAKEVQRYDVQHVDYMSLDVEGHELQVLQGIDFGKLIINVLTVEAKEEAVQPIQRLLESKGYVRHTPTLDANSRKHRRLNEDVVFVYKDVVWGKPV